MFFWNFIVHRQQCSFFSRPKTGDTIVSGDTIDGGGDTIHGIARICDLGYKKLVILRFRILYKKLQNSYYICLKTVLKSSFNHY